MTGKLQFDLTEIKKNKGKVFVEMFCNGEDFTLQDGSLIVDGMPKSNYSGIDCMQAIALPAYFAGFDDGFNAVIEYMLKPERDEK